MNAPMAGIGYPPVAGIDVLHLDAVSRDGAGRCGTAVQASPCRASTDKLKIGDDFAAGVYSTGISWRRIARVSLPLSCADGLHRFRMVFGEAGVEQVDERNVETIHPDVWRVAGVSVVVIRPRRRQDEIARCIVVRSPSTAV